MKSDLRDYKYREQHRDEAGIQTDTFEVKNQEIQCLSQSNELTQDLRALKMHK